MAISARGLKACCSVPSFDLAYPYGDKTAAAPASSHWRRRRIQDRGDDAAGHIFPKAPSI